MTRGERGMAVGTELPRGGDRGLTRLPGSEGMRAAGRPRRGVARGRPGRAGPRGAEELEPSPCPRPGAARDGSFLPAGATEGRSLQVGQELLEYLRDPAAFPDVEQDPQRLDRVIDELAAWDNSSNFKVQTATRKDIGISPYEMLFGLPYLGRRDEIPQLGTREFS